MNIFRLAGARAIPVPEVGQTPPGQAAIEAEVVLLFGQLRVPVLRYLLSCGVPIADAEEIVQEIFLLLFQSLRRGEPAANPVGWLFRTAHHFVLKRRDQVRRDAARFDSSRSATEMVADLSPGPDLVLEEAQRRNGLLAVVRALPDQDQKCLHLRAEGLRYREIAEVLGMSLGAVSNSLQRSIARIARADRK